jgi:hypothetical protein
MFFGKAWKITFWNNRNAFSFGFIATAYFFSGIAAQPEGFVFHF